MIPEEKDLTFKTLIFLHGYGVRGYYWEGIKPFFESKFAQVFNPDLQMRDINLLIKSTKKYISDIVNKYDTTVYLIGHSLGGAIGALVCQDLGSAIHKFAGIAVPYGEQQITFKKFTRYLVRHQLIPGFLSRPRFFSKQTPKSVQKSLWKRNVLESEKLQDILFSDQWFHTKLLNGALDQDSLVIASESDKIVSWEQSQEFANKIGAKYYYKFKREQNVGHNDYITAPIISQEVAERIIKFFIS